MNLGFSQITMETCLSTICDSCGKQFSNVYTLNAHKRQVHENKKPYECIKCTKSFSTKYKLNRHIQGIHSDVRDKFCEICGHAFKTREMLIKHHRTHFKGPFTCHVCNEVFKYKASFDHHFKIKHETKETSELKTTDKVKNYECKICFKVYKNFKSLQNHEENHSKGSENKAKRIKSAVETFICYVCNKNFDHKQDFEIHLTSHEDDLEYGIEDMIIKESPDIDNTIEQESVMEYVQEDSLDAVDITIKQEQLPEIMDGASQSYVEDNETIKKVIKEENGNIEFENIEQETMNLYSLDFKPKQRIKKDILEKIVCDICGMLFMNKSHLRRHHARKHRDKSDYKYECDICAVKFLLRYDLQRHMIKHNSVRDIECPQCKKQFKTKSSLDCHIKSIHDRSKLEKQFVCNICSRSYFHKRHLDYHTRKHTDDRRYGCDKCDKSFLYSDAVKWHQIRVHKEPPPFVCNLCHKKFIHYKTYETHIKEHDEETGSLSVTCPICKKKISEKRHLPRHIRTHLKKGFTCHYCHESFKERFQLTKHLLQCEDKHNKEVEIIYETFVE
ncbi:zinc finger protein 84-like [Chironomus tepperi]|uniref:zinc finger protein 84-like n=1 Tax=Chironomus tepperi TaxID=113505 RepID=UPI00391F57E8